MGSPRQFVGIRHRQQLSPLVAPLLHFSTHDVALTQKIPKLLAEKFVPLDASLRKTGHLRQGRECLEGAALLQEGPRLQSLLVVCDTVLQVGDDVFQAGQFAREPRFRLLRGPILFYTTLSKR